MTLTMVEVAGWVKGWVEKWFLRKVGDNTYTGTLTVTPALSAPTVTGSTEVITPIVRAVGAAGLRLEDDGDNLGIFVEDGGLVGIANTNPAVALDVTGTAAVSTEVITPIVRATGAGGLRLEDDGDNLGLFVEDGGYVGIGTNAPDQKLHISGPTAGSGDGETAIQITQPATTLGATVKLATRVTAGTSPSFALMVRQHSDPWATIDVFTMTDGAAWFIGDVSALSFTDRTKGYTGDALAELAGIHAKEGQLDHTTLPEFARSADGEGRDLGAMISMLTVAVQQLAARIEALEKKQP